MNEISVIGHGDNTYYKANKSCDELINENTEYNKSLDFEVTEEEKTLPIIYWIPKMHKNPTGANSIFASKICFTKQISKSVSNVLKLEYFQIEIFHKNAKFWYYYN